MPSQRRTLSISLSAAALLLAPSMALPVPTTDSTLGAFADAFVASATGGQVTSCDSATAQLGTSVGAVRMRDFSTWAGGYCINAYQDEKMCGEISAYLAATYYSYKNGWTGADLFASLGGDRISKWHNLLISLCANSAAPVDQCLALQSQWGGFYGASSGLAINSYADEQNQLASNGLLGLVDTSLHGYSRHGGLLERDLDVGSQGQLHTTDDIQGELVNIDGTDSRAFGKADVRVARGLPALSVTGSTAGRLKIGGDKLDLKGKGSVVANVLGGGGISTVDHAKLAAKVNVKSSLAARKIEGNLAADLTSNTAIKLNHLIDVKEKTKLAAHGKVNIGRDIAADVTGHASVVSYDATHIGRLASVNEKTDVNVDADARAQLFAGRDIKADTNENASAHVVSSAAASLGHLASTNEKSSADIDATAHGHVVLSRNIVADAKANAHAHVGLTGAASIDRFGTAKDSADVQVDAHVHGNVVVARNVFADANENANAKLVSSGTARIGHIASVDTNVEAKVDAHAHENVVLERNISGDVTANADLVTSGPARIGPLASVHDRTALHASAHGTLFAGRSVFADAAANADLVSTGTADIGRLASVNEKTALHASAHGTLFAGRSVFADAAANADLVSSSTAAATVGRLAAIDEKTDIHANVHGSAAVGGKLFGRATSVGSVLDAGAAADTKVHVNSATHGPVGLGGLADVHAKTDVNAKANGEILIDRSSDIAEGLAATLSQTFRGSASEYGLLERAVFDEASVVGDVSGTLAGSTKVNLDASANSRIVVERDIHANANADVVSTGAVRAGRFAAEENSALQANAILVSRAVLADATAHLTTEDRLRLDHGLLNSASAHIDANGNVVIARDISADASAHLSAADRLNLFHAVSAAGNVNANAAATIHTRDLPLSNIASTSKVTGMLSGAGSSLPLGSVLGKTGGLGGLLQRDLPLDHNASPSKLTGMLSELPTGSLLSSTGGLLGRDFYTEGSDALDVGKLVKAKGDGFLVGSSYGIVGAGTQELKAGPLDVKASGSKTTH
ncbi:hypothetical protein P7C73_g6123, partial [Tremellales sp. Uapishka_1]